MINKRGGFTLIELLGVIVILALISLIAIPNTVAFIEGKKKETFAGTAEMMLAKAKVFVTENTEIVLPANDLDATLITLAHLRINSITKDVDGGYYDRDNSYVLITKINDELVYYVTLVGSERNVSLVRDGEITSDKVTSSPPEPLKTIDETYTLDDGVVTVKNVYPVSE
ncbi:MAG: pilus assembly FimT family protein [Bacilli bacterium]|jgi:prepilin-type N-terminal cleavage/methylation domain-containing protein|nr:prepilin-type N-terminal cleavage/methylation domain-containing protein [Bacilli bacterium]